MQVIAFGIFSHARRVTTFRAPFQGLIVQKACFQGNEGINEYITVDVHRRVLATLLKTSIVITYQIAAAVQHSPRGPGNPTSTFSDLLF